VALTDQYTASQNVTFQHRVQQAVVTAAAANINGTSPVRALAQRILADPATWGARVAEGIVTVSPLTTRAAADPTGATATDAEIQTAVNALLLSYV
jgi:hypothetical protein